MLKNFKIEKVRCSFEQDTVGFYLTPLFAYSHAPHQGRMIWFGWLFWIVGYRIAKYTREEKDD